MQRLLEIAQSLISCGSVTPDDAGCQAYLAKELAALGFHIESMPFGNVSNLWARLGDQSPVFVFAGHTDVVPVGDLTAWHTPPFTPTIKDGYLYGRGAADMKSSIAAMLVACEAFFKQHPAPSGSIAFLLTSDEEGPAIDGTQKVISALQARGETIDYCLVGEPSSQTTVGDMVKIGRRGSLTGSLTVHGKQGHIAYPHLADNPIHRALPALSALTQIQWDEGNADFPPTSFQIANIHAGVGATNVIPGELTVDFNFRHCPDSIAQALQQRVIEICDQYGLDVSITWQRPSHPFYTQDGLLRTATIKAIKQVTGKTPTLSTTGGTSDGRFIATACAQVIELGPCNKTIHQINECVNIAELAQLAQIYEQLLIELLGK